MIRRILTVTALLASTAALLLPQKTDDDAILRAMRDELERSRQLRIIGGGDDVPYYFGYDLTDVSELSVSAVFGSPFP